MLVIPQQQLPHEKNDCSLLKRCTDNYSIQCHCDEFHGDPKLRIFFFKVTYTWTINKDGAIWELRRISGVSEMSRKNRIFFCKIMFHQPDLKKDKQVKLVPTNLVSKHGSDVLKDKRLRFSCRYTLLVLMFICINNKNMSFVLEKISLVVKFLRFYYNSLA